MGDGRGEGGKGELIAVQQDCVLSAKSVVPWRAETSQSAKELAKYTLTRSQAHLHEQPKYILMRRQSTPLRKAQVHPHEKPKYAFMRRQTHPHETPKYTLMRRQTHPHEKPKYTLKRSQSTPS